MWAAALHTSRPQLVHINTPPGRTTVTARYRPLDAFQTAAEDRAKNCTEPGGLLSDLPAHHPEHRLSISAHSPPNTGSEIWTRRKCVLSQQKEKTWNSVKLTSTHAEWHIPQSWTDHAKARASCKAPHILDITDAASPDAATMAPASSSRGPVVHHVVDERRVHRQQQHPSDHTPDFSLSRARNVVLTRPRMHRELADSRHWPTRHFPRRGDGMVDVG